MTNTELNLDQLQSISGGDSNTNWKAPFYNLNELAKSGELTPKMQYIHGEMYRFLPGGDMF